MTRAAGIALIAFLFLSGCSSAAPNAPQATLFNAIPDRTKVFFYVAYNNAGDQPFFNRIFRLYVDGNYVGDIDVDSYIEMTTLPAGNHFFEIDEIGWSSKVLHQATTRLHLELGAPYFIMRNVMPDEPAEKGDLLNVSTAQGEGAVLARVQQCLCKTEWGRFIDNF